MQANIRPDYEQLKKTPVDITGIDLDLHLDEYIRTYVPEFVDRRTIPDTRDRLYEELAEVGLTWNDRFEFMCRLHGRCGGSRITVERMEEDTGDAAEAADKDKTRDTAESK